MLTERKKWVKRLRRRIKEIPSVKLQHSMNIKINEDNRAGAIAETYRTMTWVAECLLNITRTWVWFIRVKQARHGNMSCYSNIQERWRIRRSRLWSLVLRTLALLAKNPGSVPSGHINQLTRISNTLFWPPWAPAHIWYTYKQAHTHK